MRPSPADCDFAPYGSVSVDVSGSCVGTSYLLIEEIGAGATGRVWRALDRGSGDQVAVKLLRQELMNDPRAVSRFVQERSILLMLQHNNIVRLRDLLTIGTSMGLVMDLVGGGSLRAYLRQHGTLAPSRATGLLAQVAEALAQAHRLGIVHRDLKPDNVLLEPTASERHATSDGDLPHVRLTDFGIARLLDSPGVTTPQSLVGTPNYLAPEVITGTAPSPAVDVYALGVLLYELLLGRPPYAGGPPVVVLRRHLECQPHRYPGIPDQAWQAVLACMAKDPARRPSAKAAAAMLRALAQQLAEAPRARPVEDPGPFADRARPSRWHSGWPSRWAKLRGRGATGRPVTDRDPPRRPGQWLRHRRRPLVTLLAGAIALAAVGTVADDLPQWVKATVPTPPSSSAALPERPATLPEYIEPVVDGRRSGPTPMPAPAVTPTARPTDRAGTRAHRPRPSASKARMPEAAHRRPTASRSRVTAPIYGPLRCTTTYRWDPGHPAMARPCHALGPGIELYGRMRAVPGVRADVSLSLQDAETGRTVAGPFVCANLTFTEAEREHGCGPFHATQVDRGHRYAVVQQWSYPAGDELPSGAARSDPFLW